MDNVNKNYEKMENQVAIIPKKLTLAQRDLYLKQIELEIQNKRQLIINKKKDIDKKSKVNEYLEGVKADYSKYYNHAVKEKQQQHTAMMLLKQYNEDMMKSAKLLDSELRVAKYEQKDILNEIDKIKKEMDEMIK